MEAKVNVTHQGQNGDLETLVPFDAPDGDIKQWVTEAVRSGGVAGVIADMGADFTDYVVDRFGATDARPYPLVSLRPKTPYGR